MNLSELQQKLLRVARQNPPGDQVPYAFERRVMARLTAAPRPSEWLAWSRALWYGAAACTAITIATALWTPAASANGDTSFTDGVEESILAATDDFGTFE